MNSSSWQIFKLLLWRQWFVVRKNIPDMVGDGLIAVSLQLISLKFFLPAMGMDTKWQLPLFVGNMLMLMFTVGYQYGLSVASDIVSAKVLYYHVALPVRPYVVLLSYILGAMTSFFALLLPVGTIGISFLAHEHALQGSILLGAGMFLLSILFFTLLFTYLGVRFQLDVYLDYMWPRVLGPMWTFGCLLFTWKRIHSFSPKISYLFFLSPVTYCVEGMRQALLGGSQFLSLQLCAGMLSIFCFVLIWLLSSSVYARLDLVTERVSS